MARYEIGDGGEWIDTNQRRVLASDPEFDQFKTADEYEVVQYMDRLEARIKKFDRSFYSMMALVCILSGLLVVL